jgi:hypothetical protein
VTIEPQDTCWTILRDARQGDSSAKEAFARSYDGPIRAYLRHRWRDRPVHREVEDATQEVFVEALKPGGVIDQAQPENGEFRGLLYAVVRNVARRFEERAAKARARETNGSVYLDDVPARAEALSKVFDKKWAQSLIRTAIRRHEEQAQGDAEALRRFHVLRMRHDDGLAIREIAANLDIEDVASVHNDYRQARRAFASHLREVVATHTGAHGAAVDRECRRLADLLGS